MRCPRSRRRPGRPPLLSRSASSGPGVIVALVGLLILCVHLLRLTFLSSAFYVLTTRRALVVSWHLFAGFKAQEYGPDLAAFPRIRRSWVVRNAGDLIMREMV